jgi:uncharacterized membrane protein YphA (DoxX/SURF4 family)
MKPKTVNILYWIFTILFAGLMIFSAVGSLTVNDDSINLISKGLGYPEYFIPFTGYAKLIGSIVILIPGLKTIKEWAYAGLFFDLAAAIYSFAAAPNMKYDPGMLSMGIWVLFGILSYVFWKKKLKAEANKNHLYA